MTRRGPRLRTLPPLLRDNWETNNRRPALQRSAREKGPSLIVDQLNGSLQGIADTQRAQHSAIINPGEKRDREVATRQKEVAELSKAMSDLHIQVVEKRQRQHQPRRPEPGLRLLLLG